MAPEEIQAIRNQYHLTVSAMSKLCGFGVNQWRNYEQGHEPNSSNLLVIQLMKDPAVFIRALSIRHEVLSRMQYDIAYRAAAGRIIKDTVVNFKNREVK